MFRAGLSARSHPVALYLRTSALVGCRRRDTFPASRTTFTLRPITGFRGEKRIAVLMAKQSSAVPTIGHSVLIEFRHEKIVEKKRALLL